MKKLSLLFFSFLITVTQLIEAQDVVITGKTTDQVIGDPLPGVNVLVKGTAAGVTSLADGTYRVTVPSGGTVLVFSYVGYESQEIEIAGRNVIDVFMAEESLVVTGYSVERKKDIIGSVSVINTEQMKTSTSGNVLNQMQGRVSGLTIYSDGAVSGSSKVRIRGFGSFGNSDPLFIIDGVPGSIDRLNPNDIKSVLVLKDAASTSVYGARAANGVVIITTRQGEQGANKVNIDYYNGVSRAGKSTFPDLLNAEEMGQLYWKQMKGAGREYGDANWTHPQYGSGKNPVIPNYIMVNINGSRIGGRDLEALRSSSPSAYAEIIAPSKYDFKTYQIVKAGDTDWFKESFRPAPVQNLQITTSGGSAQGNYFVGLGYYRMDGISDPYCFYTRYTLRTNTSFNIQKWLRVGENLQVSYQPGHNKGSSEERIWQTPSLCPVYDIGGMPAGSAIPTIIETSGGTPYGNTWRSRFDGYYNYAIFGNAFVEITPVKDLVIRSSFGIDVNYYRSKSMTQVTYELAQNVAPPNSLSWSFNDSQSWTFTNTVTYGKTLGSHVVKILLGTEAFNNLTSNINATRAELLIDNDPNYLVPSAATGTMTSSGIYAGNGLWSLFVRFDYSFADKYIMNFTLRRDGSSKFSESNRYGFFPAAAIGWRISDEVFMQGFTWLNDLKLRASYGITGNERGLSNENQFTLYQRTTAQTYSMAGTNNTCSPSYTPSRLGDPNTRWEKAISTNIGFDASFFNSATSLTLDWFTEETRDLLVTNQALSTAPAITQPMINVGSIRNRGVDFTVTQRAKIAGQIDFEATASFSSYRNKVLKILDNPSATLTGGSTRMGVSTQTKVGMPISYFWGYIIDGFCNTQEELDAYVEETTNSIIPPAIGRWKLKDINSDGIINDNDRTYMGSPHPDFQVGLTLVFKYKDFDLNSFIFINYGNELFNWSRYNCDFTVYGYNRSKRMLYDSWTPELGNKAKLPKHDINDIVSAKYASSYFIEDGSYLRMKQVQIGYTFPESLINRLKIDRIRVYIQGQNLFTLDHFTGLDAGQNISGDDLGMGVTGDITPTPRQILFGINLGF